MSDPAALNNVNYDNMTVAEFEERLPELVQSGQGKMTDDPRFTAFFEKNPDCAALVRDLDAIAEAARQFGSDLFQADEEESPTENDPMWDKIKAGLNSEPNLLDEPN